jgi:hypothetical protein
MFDCQSLLAAAARPDMFRNLFVATLEDVVHRCTGKVGHKQSLHVLNVPACTQSLFFLRFSWDRDAGKDQTVFVEQQ